MSPRHGRPPQGDARPPSEISNGNISRRENAARVSTELDGGRGAGPRGRGSRAASLFEPPDAFAAKPLESEREHRERRRRERGEERPRAREERRSARRFKPLLIGAALGPKALRPPPFELEPPPALLALLDRRPPSDAAGAPTPAAPAGLSAVEDLDPKTLPKDRHAGAHWDGDQWHDGSARGIDANGSWLWTYRDGTRLWALAGNPAQPLVRHDGAWWMKSGGMWFVVHDGEPWALRDFSDWGARGLFQPATGTQIVYSADYSRAAVITPGHGAEVFDARTGAFLGQIPEDRMPPTRRPVAPRSLPMPR
jgi:hypothetical protein